MSKQVLDSLFSCVYCSASQEVRMDKLGKSIPWMKAPTGGDDMEEWRSLRSRRDGKGGYVGASSVPAILGHPASYQGAYETWAGIMGEKSRGFDQSMMNLMSLGHIMESHALDALRNVVRYEWGHVFSEVGEYQWTVKHPEIDYFRVTPDGYAVIDDSVGVIELKYTERDFVPWMHLAKTGEILPGSKVERHWLQIQAQLAVTGLDWGILAGVVGARAGLRMVNGMDPEDGFVCVRVDRDPETTDRIESAVVDFWSHVESGEPPRPNRHSDDRAVRRDLRDTVDGKEILREDMAETVASARGLASRISEMKKALGVVKAEIRLAMGDAEVMKVGDGEKPVTWKAKPKGGRLLLI